MYIYTNCEICACAYRGSGRGCTGWKPVIFAEFISRLTSEQKKGIVVSMGKGEDGQDETNGDGGSQGEAGSTGSRKLIDLRDCLTDSPRFR